MSVGKGEVGYHPNDEANKVEKPITLPNNYDEVSKDTTIPPMTPDDIESGIPPFTLNDKDKGSSTVISSSGSGIFEGVNKAGFASEKKLDQHYEKHVKKQNEFGNITKEEYLEKANEFIKSNGSYVLSKTALNGDVLKYNKVTNEFSIVTKDGVLRTYYKLDPKNHNKGSNMDYWNGPDCTY